MKTKKTKRNVLFGGPMDPGDEFDPTYKVMKCSHCGKKIIMMREQWDETLNPESLLKLCLVCVYDFA